MNLFKNIKNSIQNKIRLKKFKNAMKAKVETELLSSPSKQEEVSKQINCLIHGHKWKTEPIDELAKPIHKRTYCTKCGVYYHEHKYHK